MPRPELWSFFDVSIFLKHASSPTPHPRSGCFTMAERQFLNRFSVLRCSGFHPSGRLFGNSLRRSHHSLHTYSSKHHPTVQRAAPRRYIQSASPRHINILDSTDKDNATKQPEQGLQSTQAAPISNDEYHERSDRFFEELLEKLEDLSEQRGDVDVEYSVRWPYSTGCKFTDGRYRPAS